MKRFFVLFLLILVNIGVYAQSDTFKVKDDSFHKVEGCVTIPVRYDDNDYPMALLKIITENINEQDRAKLYFEGNLATFIEVEQNIGETWVYLTAEAATFIRIKHPDFGVTEFWFPMNLKPKQCYEMVLQNTIIAPVNNKAFIVLESDPSGADIYIDGEHYGQTPKVISELHIGEHLIIIEKEGYTPISKRITIKERETLTFSETLEKSSLVNGMIEKEESVMTKPIIEEEVVSSSEKNHSGERMKCLMLNASYSVAPQMSYGLTYGQVKRFGWFISATTNFQFRFKGNDAKVGVVNLTGNNSSSRLSLMGGLAVRVSGPVYAKIGTGYGMRVKCWEAEDANWYVYEPDTYKGLDLSAGLLINAKGYVFSLDAVTTSFKTLEIKIGIGLSWN